MTRRIETFNFGLLFGTETSPTYSQQETPVESFHVDTDTACSTPVEPDTLRYVYCFTVTPITRAYIIIWPLFLMLDDLYNHVLSEFVLQATSVYMGQING